MKISVAMFLIVSFLSCAKAYAQGSTYDRTPVNQPAPVVKPPRPIVIVRPPPPPPVVFVEHPPRVQREVVYVRPDEHRYHDDREDCHHGPGRHHGWKCNKKYHNKHKRGH